MPVTITDVAREAKVSIATVSRVVNRPDTVKVTTRQRVQEIIERTGYRPNPWARTLPVGNPDSVIGLVIPEIHNPVFPELAESVEHEARRRGFQVMLCHTDDKWAIELNYTNLLIDRKVTGIIFASGSFSHVDGNREGYRLLDAAGVPYVFLNSRTTEGSPVPSVATDEFQAGEMQAEYLLSRGHRRLAFLGGGLGYYVTRDRLAGIRATMLSYPDSLLIEELGLFSPDHAVRATRRLLQAQEPPSAIICASDFLAFVVMKEIRLIGYQVPQDISVIGFDGIQMGRYTNPALTTIAQPLAAMGRRAVSLVLGDKPPRTKLGLTITPGESVRFLSGSN